MPISTTPASRARMAGEPSSLAPLLLKRSRPASTCATISAAVRLRLSPAMPDAQNTQPIAQPTCELMHCVTGGAAPCSTSCCCVVRVRRLRRVHVVVVDRAARDQHALDALLVVQLEHELVRAVDRRAHLGDRERRLQLGREPLAQRLRQVAHARRIDHAALVDPAKHLQRAVARLAPLREPLRPLFGQALERGLWWRERRARLGVGCHGHSSGGRPLQELVQDRVAVVQQRQLRVLVRLVRLALHARAEVHRRHAELVEARDVGPGLLRPWCRPRRAAISALHERMACVRAAAGDRSVSSTTAWPRDELRAAPRPPAPACVSARSGGSGSARSDPG